MKQNIKPVYLTTNKGKFKESEYIFKEKYLVDIDIMEPYFEILEIQTTAAKR